MLKMFHKVWKKASNKIYVITKDGVKKRVFKIPGLKFKFNGEKSTVIIQEPILKFKKSKIICGTNCLVEIGASKERARRLLIHASADNSVVKIGNNFSCTNGCLILSHEESNLKIEIGNDRMFGSNVLIRNSDAHTILDKTTKEILNYGKNVCIDDNVWIARDCVVLKGVNIAKNSIVGANSLVSKSCLEENSIYVGMPAKKIRGNIEWDRRAIDKYVELSK